MPGLIRKMEHYRPAWVVFHGKTSAKVVSRALGRGSRVRLGRQPWTVAGLPVFVLPSASAANRNVAVLEGMPSRIAWFRALARLLPPVPGHTDGGGAGPTQTAAIDAEDPPEEAMSGPPRWPSPSRP